MSFPPHVIWLPATYYSSREGQAIKCIIAHDTERPNDDSNSIKYLQTGGGRKVSIHALIEPDGTIYEMVKDDQAANHAGYGTLTLNGITYSPDQQYGVNQISLGFELEYTKAPNNKPYPNEQLLSMGWWVAHKRERYGALPIYRHEDIDPDRRSDTRNLSVAEIEHWVSKTQLISANVPTIEKPLPYRFIVPQVVYTDRSLSSKFAGTTLVPVVMGIHTIVLIGDITGDWAWIATGIGFVPKNTLVRVN